MSPTYVPPLAAFTAQTMQTSTVPTTVSPFHPNLPTPAQGADTTSLGVKVESLIAELLALKTMMTELLQRQLSTTPNPVATQNPLLPPVMPGSAAPTTAVPTTAVPHIILSFSQALALLQPSPRCTTQSCLGQPLPLLVPPKFKPSEFEKFKGTECPELHLKHFCHKTSVYPADDKLRITMFQESLAESALQWYYSKDLKQFATFKELALDFLNYYIFNVEMAPTLSDIRKLRRFRGESITTFAQRFREMAAQIKPPMQE
ncbi:hypothetical protein MLD38_033873 [Melastoma candidum]|uniref:Uncharacterized protein n=1 Tax=Melastoma candidum TaxID=119954 RepID=A0ACB9MBX6_9MYRT|nr:hypothetical protein MLD38_033873 [Melastoma candidum]